MITRQTAKPMAKNLMRKLCQLNRRVRTGVRTKASPPSSRSGLRYASPMVGALTSAGTSATGAGALIGIAIGAAGALEAGADTGVPITILATGALGCGGAAFGRAAGLGDGAFARPCMRKPH